MASSESRVDRRSAPTVVSSVPVAPGSPITESDSQASPDPRNRPFVDPAHARPNRLRRILVGLDAAVSFAAWAVAMVLWTSSTPGTLSVGVATTGTLLATAMTVLLVGAHRLYRARVCAVRAVEAARLGRSVLLTSLALLWTIDVMSLPVSWVAVALGGTLSLTGLMIGRAAFRRKLADLRRHGVGVRAVVLVGGNEDAADLLRLTQEHPEHGYVVYGVVADRTSMRPELAELPWLGRPEQAHEALRRSGAAGALIAGRALPSDVFNNLVRELSDTGYHVQISHGLQGISHQRLLVSPLAHEPLYYLEGTGFTPPQLATKRALDVILSTLALVVLAPVFAGVALAIRLTEGSPVLFRQQRMGRHDEPFTLLKFRTMVTDAEDRLAELAEDNARSGPLFKMAGDPRVTRLGRFLRASSLDELPQFVNVLRGEMSLVGPRPALPTEVLQFGERLRSRTRVRPGITGLWQVEARDNPSFWSYERLDLFYVENWSVGLDLSILLGTAATVTRRGFSALAAALPSRDRQEAEQRVTARMLD